MAAKVIIFCPACGEEVFVPVFLRNVELKNGYLLAEVGSALVEHKCSYLPDTDGLEPIQRFVNYGELDDMGRKGRRE